MHFTFDTLDYGGQFQTVPRNLTNCRDKNPSGISRFTPSPIVIGFMLHSDKSGHTFGSTHERGQIHVIATGVAHAPWDWCGPDSIGQGFNNDVRNRKSLFDYLTKKQRKALRKGGAYLLIDQSHEGYQTKWLWSWFHNNCKTYNINPKQIIYVTGNLDCTDQYNTWADSYALEDRILTIPYPHFEPVISNILNDNLEKYPTFEQHLEYKLANIDTIKTYSALQKRPRAHRAWFFKHLSDANLLEHGINSMNTFRIENTNYEGKIMTEDEYRSVIHQLPMLPPTVGIKGLKTFASDDCAHYLEKFNEETMLDTWLTVVSEASFGESENECFISEKTFKPIACNHPFIIAGNQGSLHRLRELGYKTFSPFIDESYDSLPTWQRMAAITAELTRINNMSVNEKIEWYQGMQEILDHNYKLLKFKSHFESISSYSNIIEKYTTSRNS
jgi:hypothetical protein|tara:strand:+ start:131 stop:1459 length:1329 start_codon:yes stop_codon:yes gene_type:complete